MRLFIGSLLERCREFCFKFAAFDRSCHAAATFDASAVRATALRHTSTCRALQQVYRAEVEERMRGDAGTIAELY